MDISENTEELKGYRSLSFALLVKILHPYVQSGTNVDALREILENCVPQEESGDSLVEEIDDATLRKIVSGERHLPKQYAAELLRNFDPNALELYLKEKIDAVSEQSLPALCEDLKKYVPKTITDENLPQVLAERIQHLIESAATAERQNARKESPFPKEMGDWDSEEHHYKKTVNDCQVEIVRKVDKGECSCMELWINGKKVAALLPQDYGEDAAQGFIENGKTMHYEPDSLENTGSPVFTEFPLEIFLSDDPTIKQYLKKLKNLGINTGDESDTNTGDESDTNTTDERDTNTSGESGPNATGERDTNTSDE